MNPLAAVLRFPLEVPLHLTRIEIEVVYTARGVQEGLPADRALRMGDVTGNLAGLLRAGFLCRPMGPDDTARIGLRQIADDRLLLGYAGRGAHLNLVVVMLRLLLAYHQTPEGMEDELRAIAENPEEVADYFTPMVFGDLVKDIVARQLVALPGAPMRSAPDGSRALSQDMPLPASGPLGPDPVVAADVLRVSGAGVPDPVLEDDWLTLSQFNLFLPPGHDPEFEPGDEEFLPAAAGKGLAIEEISVEQVFLFELLAVLSGGRTGQLAVTVS